jgi:hypothetical protein
VSRVLLRDDANSVFPWYQYYKRLEQAVGHWPPLCWESSLSVLAQCQNFDMPIAMASTRVFSFDKDTSLVDKLLVTEVVDKNRVTHFYSQD